MAASSVRRLRFSLARWSRLTVRAASCARMGSASAASCSKCATLALSTASCCGTSWSAAAKSLRRASVHSGAAFDISAPSRNFSGHQHREDARVKSVSDMRAPRERAWWRQDAAGAGELPPRDFAYNDAEWYVADVLAQA